MMNKSHAAFLFLIAAFFLVACSNGGEESAPSNTSKQLSDGKPVSAEPVELTISAAVSLTDALYKIQELYEKEHDVQLTFNLAGSGTLAQQIQQGAPADVFISANEDWMNTLEESDIILKESRQNVTGNSIVLITRKDADISYDSIEDMQAEEINQIAMGNPDSVPAGKYTKQILKQVNLWNKLADNMILAKDVRQVLTYVASGNADSGFVYGSDALASDSVSIVTTAKKDWHDPIIYPGAVVADTPHEKEATDFIQYMLSDEAQTILKEYGFKQ